MLFAYILLIYIIALVNIFIYNNNLYSLHKNMYIKHIDI